MSGPPKTAPVSIPMLNGRFQRTVEVLARRVSVHHRHAEPMREFAGRAVPEQILDPAATQRVLGITDTAVRRGRAPRGRTRSRLRRWKSRSPSRKSSWAFGSWKLLAIGSFAIEVAVAVERAVAAVHQEGVAAEVGGVRPPEEVEEHRFVVAQQEMALEVAGAARSGDRSPHGNPDPDRRSRRERRTDRPARGAGGRAARRASSSSPWMSPTA